MPKITRYTGNLEAFASNATGTNRTVFGDTSQSDDLTANINTDFLAGWEIVGVNENPTKQDFNALAYTTTQLAAYLHQVGVAEWDTAQEYYTGSMVNRSGTLFSSLTDSNIGNDPATDAGTNWTVMGSASYTSMADLQSPGVDNEIRVIPSFHAGANKGGGLFKYSSAENRANHNGITIIDPTNTADLSVWDATEQAAWFAAGTGSGCWLRVYDGLISVHWAGAKGDDATDDTLPLQAAVDLSGKTFLPVGTYKVSSPITVSNDNTAIIGEGSGSKIKTYATTGAIFVVNAGGGQISGCLFRDFSIWANAVKTTGAAFDCAQAARITWDRVFIGDPLDYSAAGENRLWDGIDLDRFDHCVVSGCYILTQHEGVACNGDASGESGEGLWINKGTTITGQVIAGGSAVHIGGGTEKVYLNDCDLLGGQDNLKLSKGRQASATNKSVFLGATVTLHGALSQGISVTEDGCITLNVSGSRVSSAGADWSLGNGVYVAPDNPNLHLTLTGVRLTDNAGGGLIAFGGDIVVTGGRIASNGSGALVSLGNGYGNGIWAADASVRLYVSGTQIDDNGKASIGAGYGIKAIATVSYLNIDGGSLIGNQQGTISYSGTIDSNRRVGSFAGFPGRVSGIATVTSGHYGVTVTHGLQPSGRPVGVSITPIAAGELPPQSGLYSTSTPDQTSFEIYLGGALASRDNVFRWEAFIT
jgi:hypothetical protein